MKGLIRSQYPIEAVNSVFEAAKFDPSGLSDKRDAKKYADQMLKAGFIKHTVNKSSFR